MSIEHARRTGERAAKLLNEARMLLAQAQDAANEAEEAFRNATDSAEDVRAVRWGRKAGQLADARAALEPMEHLLQSRSVAEDIGAFIATCQAEPDLSHALPEPLARLSGVLGEATAERLRAAGLRRNTQYADQIPNQLWEVAI